MRRGGAGNEKFGVRQKSLPSERKSREDRSFFLPPRKIFVERAGCESPAAEAVQQERFASAGIGATRTPKRGRKFRPAISVFRL
jgi:hypothetical protein